MLTVYLCPARPARIVIRPCPSLNFSADGVKPSSKAWLDWLNWPWPLVAFPVARISAPLSSSALLAVSLGSRWLDVCLVEMMASSARIDEAKRCPVLVSESWWLRCQVVPPGGLAPNRLQVSLVPHPVTGSSRGSIKLFDGN